VYDKAPDIPVPDWDDPRLEFWDFDDKPVATFDNNVFSVLPDKKLRPSRLAESDIWYRSSSIDRYEAEEWSMLASFSVAS
jgi:hypothetical protein